MADEALSSSVQYQEVGSGQQYINTRVAPSRSLTSGASRLRPAWFLAAQTPEALTKRLHSGRGGSCRDRICG